MEKQRSKAEDIKAYAENIKMAEEAKKKLTQKIQAKNARDIIKK